MVNRDTADQIWTLRMEAEQSRRLADSLNDPQSVADLEAYALELEAEAAKLQWEDLARPAWDNEVHGDKRGQRTSKWRHPVSAS
jgi:hypothetical protein